MQIISWSPSRLQTGDGCKHRAYLKYGAKIPEPERALRPGKTEHANDRGTRYHENAELYIKGKTKLLPDLKTFLPEFERLQELRKQNLVHLEEEWALNHEWERVEWKSPKAWLRLKIDAMIRIKKHEAVVVDYKTGKRFGNEIKHAEQVQLYQLVTFLLFPDIDIVHTELWYTDVNDLFHQKYTRDQGLHFFKRFNERGTNFTTYNYTGDAQIDANPSSHVCRYCPYGPPRPDFLERTGHCKRGK
jgi:PD-(D/E)XK nuclease superfamily